MLLEPWQAWCCDHYSEEPVPAPSRPPNEKTFPDIQPKHPNTASCSSFWLYHLLPERNQHLPSSSPHEEAVDCDEAPITLLQAE